MLCTYETIYVLHAFIYLSNTKQTDRVPKLARNTIHQEDSVQTRFCFIKPAYLKQASLLDTLIETPCDWILLLPGSDENYAARNIFNCFSQSQPLLIFKPSRRTHHSHPRRGISEGSVLAAPGKVRRFVSSSSVFSPLWFLRSSER